MNSERQVEKINETEGWWSEKILTESLLDNHEKGRGSSQLRRGITEPSVVAQPQHSRCEDRRVFVSLELAWSTGDAGLHSESVSWKRNGNHNITSEFTIKSSSETVANNLCLHIGNVHAMKSSTETTNRQNHGEITVANIVWRAICLGKFRIKLLGFVI